VSTLVDYVFGQKVHSKPWYFFRRQTSFESHREKSDNAVVSFYRVLEKLVTTKLSTKFPKEL